jgi:DNA repair exonuclease SbcCD ATPase subunit
MIPHKIELKNFLCYAEGEGGEPVRFDFEGAKLWSLSGDNGAGKSAIFDGITYTLFGEHRGGKQGDERLIRKGAASCEACFEFEIGGQRYRVQRTVAKNGKTCGAAQWDPAAGEWLTIQGTDRDPFLREWVKKQLGFGSNTFGASVLLQQGKSDRLLEADPKDRFDILSNVLDLQVYKVLELRALDRQKSAKSEAEVLGRQLMARPQVSDEDVKTAAEEAEQKRKQLELTQKALTEATLVTAEARLHAKLTSDIAEKQERIRENAVLLQDGDRVRKEYQEWQALELAVPKLTAALDDITEARKHQAQATADHEKALALVLDQLAAEAEMEGRKAKPSNREAEAELARIDELTEALQQRERKAGETCTSCRTLLAQAKQRLELREAARDEAVCSRCGQPVDAKHIAQELADAAAEVEGLTKQLKDEQAAQKFWMASVKRVTRAQSLARAEHVSMATADTCKQRAKLRMEGLEPAWTARALAGEQGLVAELEQRQQELANAKDDYERLLEAEHEGNTLAAELAQLQKTLAEIPPEHRIPVEEAQSSEDAARDSLDVARHAWSAAEHKATALAQALEERRELQKQTENAKLLQWLWMRLAGLLGRSGLQAQLLAAAIEGISQLANETLGRISGNQLRIDIKQERKGTRDQILILATDYASAQEPLDVQFLSGSQKFRTSVALAAAIGQYAGRGAASVRSLIIDEGFGSLDKHGREEMIDELGNLATLLDRLIVVSHQDDFQDRTLFPTGYVLRKVNGRTEVERFV